MRPRAVERKRLELFFSLFKGHCLGKTIHFSIVFASVILQQPCFEWRPAFKFVIFFLILCLYYCYYSSGPSRRTPHLSRRSSHPVRQPAHPSCHLQHHGRRRAAPHHRRLSAAGLQAEVTRERPHSEAPADADGQSGVPSSSGVQRG